MVESKEKVILCSCSHSNHQMCKHLQSVESSITMIRHNLESYCTRREPCCCMHYVCASQQRL